MKLAILGDGGFAREVLVLAKQIEKFRKEDWKFTFAVPQEYYTKTIIHGCEVVKIEDLKIDEFKFVTAIGDSKIREKIHKNYGFQPSHFINLIHPSVEIDTSVKLGIDVIITSGCIITADITIGNHVHLNMQTTVGHDTNIDDYFTSAPSTNISGSCKIGKHVYFGTQSAVKQGIEICDNVTIGMGAMVTKCIESPGFYIGMPLKKIT